MRGDAHASTFVSDGRNVKDCISVGECKFKFSNAVRTSEDKSSKDAINCSSLSSADEVDDAAADVAALRTLP